MATLESYPLPPVLTAQTPFTNEPFVDFTEPENKRRMQEALAEVENQLGREYDIDHRRHGIKTTDKIISTNPARPAQVIGIHQRAEAEHVEPAMKAAQAAFTTWSRTPVAERAALLFRAAELIRERNFEFCAWLTLEVGKNWAEADADVGETIDFLEFYGREALRLDQREDAHPVSRRAQPAPLHSARRRCRHSALELPLRHHGRHDRRVDRLRQHRHPEAFRRRADHRSPFHGASSKRLGLPDGVVNLCPGEGPGFGSAVVAHPQTRFIAFTGSKAVGLEIHERAAKTQPGQIFIKRTILEMGGKDSIIVDGDADLDAAVEGVVASAFGFNGQKCSACSRAIVDAGIYDIFCDRLQARVAKIKTGDPAENVYTGPVISEKSYKKILDYIEIGKDEGRVLNGGHAIETPGGRLLHRPDRNRRRRAHGSHRAGRDLRPRPRRHQVARASTKRSPSPTTPSTA